MIRSPVRPRSPSSGGERKPANGLRAPRIRGAAKEAAGASEGDAAAPAPSDDDQTPDERIVATHDARVAALRQEVLERVVAAPPGFFEGLILDRLRAMGYGGSSATEGARARGRSGDGGPDGVMIGTRLGFDQVCFQAKRYRPGNTVGSGAVRDFYGALVGAKAGQDRLITTSGFTPSARETARGLPNRAVLIDGDRLAGPMIEHDVGLRVERVLRIKRVDEGFFPEK